MKQETKKPRARNPITAVIRAKYGSVSRFCAITGLRERIVRDVILGDNAGKMIGSQGYKALQIMKCRGVLVADGKAA